MPDVSPFPGKDPRASLETLKPSLAATRPPSVCVSWTGEPISRAPVRHRGCNLHANYCIVATQSSKPTRGVLGLRKGPWLLKCSGKPPESTAPQHGDETQEGHMEGVREGERGRGNSRGPQPVIPGKVPRTEGEFPGTSFQAGRLSL